MLKFTILLFLFFVHSFTVLANSSITLAQVFTIQSEALREQRDYSVYLPPSYQSDEARHFPVIYVLDGDEHRLKAIAGIVEGLSTDTLEKQVQEAIIVAIPNSKNAIRERDFTPTNVNWEFNGQVLEKFENIGNAANYLEFFQRELLPHINKTYRTTQQSLLIGESFGGLFAAYALLSQPGVFTDYLIIDATFLWHNNYLNRYLQNNKLKLGNSEIHAYFTFANNTGFGEIGKTNQAWGYQLFDSLNALKQPNFHLQKRYFDDESHGTVAMLSWYYGLKQLLKSK